MKVILDNGAVMKAVVYRGRYLYGDIIDACAKSKGRIFECILEEGDKPLAKMRHAIDRYIDRHGYDDILVTVQRKTLNNRLYLIRLPD